MDTPGEPKTGPLLGSRAKILRATFLIWLLFGLLPAFFGIFGFDYIPSADWVIASNGVGIGFGLATGLVFLCSYLANIDKVPGGDVKKTLGAFAAPFFGYFSGKSAVVVSCPMILALIAGAPIELSYTVERATGRGSRHCRLPVELQHLPLFLDNICGVSDDVRKTLTPGTHVVVIGRGTRYGVYVDRILKVD